MHHLTNFDNFKRKFTQSNQLQSPNALALQEVRNHQMELISDHSSGRQSNLSNEIYWSDFLNLSFSTKIFSRDSDYIYELGNIYAARAQIDAGMSEIIPNIHVYKRLAGHIQGVFEALDMHKVATKRCIDSLETHRKDMYRVTKRVMQLKDQLQQ